MGFRLVPVRWCRASGVVWIASFYYRSTHAATFIAPPILSFLILIIYQQHLLPQRLVFFNPSIMSALLTPPITPGSSSFPFTAETKKTQYFPTQTSLPTPPDSPVKAVFTESSRTSIDSLSISSGSSEKVSECERVLSDNELSYFLPGRADGVNDM